MSASSCPYTRFVRPSLLLAAAHIALLALPSALIAQSVPPALESPSQGPPQTGPHGEKLLGMPKFHQPAPYDMDEHTGYTQIFDGKSFKGWDADTNVWRIENGIMVGETLPGKPIGSVVFQLTGNCRSEGPASISATRTAGSAESRLAMTQPAAPAPTTM